MKNYHYVLLGQISFTIIPFLLVGFALPLEIIYNYPVVLGYLLLAAVFVGLTIPLTLLLKPENKKVEDKKIE